MDEQLWESGIRPTYLLNVMGVLPSCYPARCASVSIRKLEMTLIPVSWDLCAAGRPQIHIPPGICHSSCSRTHKLHSSLGLGLKSSRSRAHTCDPSHSGGGGGKMAWPIRDQRQQLPKTLSPNK